jgi:putative ATP-dependent endonuclease of OLD family
MEGFMFLSRIEITNFRNFRHLDVRLGSTTVVVGENNVGKSNLLFALRLVLDPRLPDSARQLREEDFWQGLKKPIQSKFPIEVAVQFQDFQNDKDVLAVLQPYLVKASVPDTARLTYRFRPRAPLPKGRALTIEDYEFVVFGGTDEKNRIGHEVRRWIPLDILPALRDAETDLSAWRDSPLRPLIERLQLSTTTLEAVANAIDKATEQLLSEQDVKTLRQAIEERLSKMIGSVLSVGPSFGFTATDPGRLLRSLRLFGDGTYKRPVGDLSLGVNNILYLLLLSMELERKEAASERATTILAIEEPEAHLHPHLQRLVFRDFLRRQSPVLLTTHSPHIASVSPLPSILLLKKDPSEDCSLGQSIIDAQLLPQEIADLERYLDATRAEMLFARGVILVEGAAELFLIPAFANLMGKSLDEYGVTVCSVHGTDFIPYAKLLGPKGLNIPFVVVTDGDWVLSDGQSLSMGLRRAVNIAASIEHPAAAQLDKLYRSRDWDTLRNEAMNAGIFVGVRTLEADLFDKGYGKQFGDTLRELGAPTKMLERIEAFVNKGAPLPQDDVHTFLEDIERFGKGRVAQRLSSKIGVDKCPAHVSGAITRIVEVLSL